MKIQHHDQPDRIAAASVAGALQNLSGKVARGELDQVAAVDELHAITRDRHLLAHGLCGLGDPGKWTADALPLQLALAAGVDLVEAGAIYVEMHPPGGRGMRLGRAE